MIRRATHFLSDLFLTNCCFGQKIKQLLEDLKKMEQDHQSTLVHLEREKILRCERLKAAQVKKKPTQNTVPLESKNSCEVGFTLQSSLITKPVAAIYLVTLLIFSSRCCFVGRICTSPQ